MRLDTESRDLLGRARIGMLALAAGREPLVNPAAFSYQGGEIWMTTSRYAAKLGLARRDPRASFLVEAQGRSVLLEGVLEVFDLRSLGGGMRALLEGPRFPLAMAGYALKNAAFIGGYLVDLAGVPREWWPQNRIVMRLSPDRQRELVLAEAEPAQASRMGGAPVGVTKTLDDEATAILCWVQGGYPQLAPALWVADGDDLLAWVPEELGPPRAGIAATAVVEYHHPYRATRMVGACPRGELVPDVTAAEKVGRRYGARLKGGCGLRLRARRVTWWRGFEVHTALV